MRAAKFKERLFIFASVAIVVAARATPPKPHSDMKIGKPKAKSGKSQRPKT
jgi:hypothetical protein